MHTCSHRAATEVVRPKPHYQAASGPGGAGGGRAGRVEAVAIAEVAGVVDEPSAQLVVAFGAPVALDTIVANMPPDFEETEVDGTRGGTGRRGGGEVDIVHGKEPSGSKRIVHPGSLIEKGCTTGACMPTPVVTPPCPKPVEEAVGIGSGRGVPVKAGVATGGVGDIVAAAAGVGGGGPAGL